MWQMASSLPFPMEDLRCPPRFSPDGNVVAFVRDNNLFVVKLLYGNAETQVTKDGKRNEGHQWYPRLGE